MQEDYENLGEKIEAETCDNVMNDLISVLHPALEEIKDTEDTLKRTQIIKTHCGDGSRCFDLANNMFSILSTDIF